MRSALRKCVVCTKVFGRPFRLPETPDLPERRVSRLKHAFQDTAADFFGPLYIIMEDNRIQKVHVVLFTCLASRMIHLEPIYSLTTSEFILSLRRFIADFGVRALMV